MEARVLDSRFERLLGYAPQADVLLASNDGLHRLWIEFEVSRADPVANHAKFATAHLFQPQRPTRRGREAVANSEWSRRALLCAGHRRRRRSG